MGVEGFNGYLRNNLPWKKAYLPKKLSKVSSLFMDFNGIIHKAKSKVYLLEDTSKMSQDEIKELEAKRKKLLRKSKASLEKQHISVVLEILEEVINTFNPVDNLFIAIDGVVNSGKLSQQKGRRFKTGKESEKDEYLVFDGNAITPGTDFMINLDTALEKWFLENHSNLSTKVIYSSHLSPGEGEHKIFDYIRRDDYIKGEGMNIIYGLDNDLIILSVLSPLTDFYMYPEEKKQKEMIHVDRLRELIIEEMKFSGSQEKLLIQDFCVVTTLLGNDFIHKFPNFLELRKSFPFIFKIYKFVKKHLTDENNNIVWENYLKYLITADNYNNSKNKYFTYINYYLSTKENSKHIPFPEYEKNIISNENRTLSFNMGQFAKDWYSKQFNKDIVQWDGEIVDDYSGRLVREMCVNYLQMIQWIQYYYTKGYKYVSNFQFYHYIYNPLMGSVIKVLAQMIKEKKTNLLRDVVRQKDDLKITALHQLLSVLPKTSVSLLPKGSKKFYNKLSKINPTDFFVSKENTYKSHQSYAIIPTINVPYVNQLMEQDNIKIPSFFDDKDDIVLYKKMKSSENGNKKMKSSENGNKKMKSSENGNKKMKSSENGNKKMKSSDSEDEYSVSMDELL